MKQTKLGQGLLKALRIVRYDEEQNLKVFYDITNDKLIVSNIPLEKDYVTYNPRADDIERMIYLGKL